MAVTDVVVEAFTELAPRYEEAFDRELRTIWGVSYADLVARLVETVPAAGSGFVLDVATGTARIPMTMADRLAEGVTVGLDITPAALRRGLADIRARGLNLRVKLVCASAMAMPFSEGFFDTVICGLVMHHMDVPKVLSEIKRVLRNGGHLVMADVGAPRLWRSSVASAVLGLGARVYGLARRGARARAEAATVLNLRTVSEWQATLSDIGFSGIEIMDRFPGRYLWYPSALTLRAIKSAA